MKYNIVIPIIYTDIDLAKINIEYIYKYLEPNKIVIIGEKSLEKHFRSNRTIFMDEDLVYEGMTLESIKHLLAVKSGNLQRAGWYFQQFLKMAYAYACEEEYYLVWDADTIPLRKMSFFKHGKPCLDLKREFNKDYFVTLEKVLDLKRTINKSFICEHMLIKKNIMLKLIHEIEARYEIQYYEAIIKCIDKRIIDRSGFSEFETYGTYVVNKYKDVYVLRNNKRSLRHGKRYLLEPNAENLEWAAKSYFTISFEKSDTISAWARFMVENKLIKKIPLRIVVFIERIMKHICIGYKIGKR